MAENASGGRREHTSVRRIVGMAVTLVGLLAVSLPLGSTVVSAQDTSSSPVIVFDDAAHQAQLIIPTPACPTSDPSCQWKFFLNEPKLSVDVGTVYGTSGTLTIPYPSDFCGVIQADAYVGPPWVARRGFQHTIEDCTPPSAGASSTTTATEPPTLPAAPATSVPAPPASVPPTSGGPTGALPFTGSTGATASSAPPASPVATPASAAPSQLPFTGIDTAPLVAVGSALVMLGLYLLTTTATRRRLLRRVANCPWPASTGARRRP